MKNYYNKFIKYSAIVLIAISPFVSLYHHGHPVRDSLWVIIFPIIAGLVAVFRTFSRLGKIHEKEALVKELVVMGICMVLAIAMGVFYLLNPQGITKHILILPLELYLFLLALFFLAGLYNKLFMSKISPSRLLPLTFAFVIVCGASILYFSLSYWYLSGKVR